LGTREITEFYIKKNLWRRKKERKKEEEYRI